MENSKYGFESRTSSLFLANKGGDYIQRNRTRMRLGEIIIFPTDEENLLLFYDLYGNRFFERSRDDIFRASSELNSLLVEQEVTLNNFYNILRMSPIETGDKIGWTEPRVKIKKELFLFEGERCFQIIFDPVPNIL